MPSAAVRQRSSPVPCSSRRPTPRLRPRWPPWASGIIGSVTFWGSLVAFDKLQQLILPGRPIHFPAQHIFNGVLALAALGLGAWVVIDPATTSTYAGLVVVGSVLGILLTIPIGGADMPVAIALLNSYSGLAAASTGFVLDNNILIITGSLVGASGIFLTRIMCRAMNRSLLNVLAGAIGPEMATKTSADEVYVGRVKSASPEEVAMLFDGVRRVVIVPGYGMAVSQAQHQVRDLGQPRGVTRHGSGVRDSPCRGADAGAHERAPG